MENQLMKIHFVIFFNLKYIIYLFLNLIHIYIQKNINDVELYGSKKYI